MSPTPCIGPVRRKVLLVEDAPPMQRVLARVIASMPRLVLVGIADSATAAIADFARHAPEVVVLDLVLRASNGFEVLRAIKRRAPSCQVVVFTTHDVAQYRAHCQAEGADYFFSKRGQHRELVEHLRALGDEPLPALTPIVPTL
jgi:DNA-binding NarL/FixJ family response regulator